MGKQNAVILAFLHFLVTEMRTIWLLWYTVFSTFQSIVIGTSISDVYGSYEISKCLNEETITVNEIDACLLSAYRAYLAEGPQLPYRGCSDVCDETEVWINANEPRIMLFFMSVWLFGFLLVLLLYCIYRRPNYHTGSYVRFTQTLYASKAYKIVANCTFVVSVLVILIGIYILIREKEPWRQYVVALLLMLIASRTLVRSKSNGLDINSERFSKLDICRGNAFMKVVIFFLTTNAVLLDEMEVQVMQKGLPNHVAAPEDREEGCLAFFSWYPLSDKSIGEFLAGEDDNDAHEMTTKA